MMRLLRVELTRLRWRRATLALVALAIVVPAVLGAVRIHETAPLDASARAEIISTNASDVDRCLRKPRQYAYERGVTRAQCEARIVEYYGYRETLDLANERDGSGFGVVSVLVIALLLLGATFAGHDWNTGSMSNQVLFEPRRGRVWTAKVLAIGLLAGIVASVVSLSYWWAMWFTVRSRDLPMADDALRDTLAYAMRGAGFVACAAIGGFALTMLLRSTVATLGILFGLSVAGGLILATLGISDRWSPPVNLAAVMQNGTTYQVEVDPSCFASGRPSKAPECQTDRYLSGQGGLLYYGVPLLVVIGASVITFRRRDIP